MSETGLSRPHPSEYDPYVEEYVSEVSEAEILPVLAAQPRELRRALAAVGEERAGFRYAPGKWSIREVVGHLTDAERLFAYRAMCFARGDRQVLPGFEEDRYVAEARFDRLPIGELVDEFGTLREGTLHLLRHLPEDAWKRGGTANGRAITVRAQAYVIAGHVRHHLRVLRERYRVEARL
jgi:hypothetical protein